MKKKGAAVIVSLALVIASVLPHTLAVYAGQDAGAVSGGIEVSVPEESVPEEPVCICDPQPADDEAHGEDCPLYEPAEGPDYEALYQRLMAAQTEEELDEVLAGFSEEELAAFEAWLTENGLTEELEEHLAALLPESEPVGPSAVSYTDVGPLLPLPAPLRAGMLKAPAKDGADTGVVLNKEAVAVDGGYKITLEAYATGESSTSTVIQPVDIVLVLDVSGSMDDRMTEYREVYELDKDLYYYVKENGQYNRIHWRGWPTYSWGNGFSSYDPKTSEDDTNPDHVQFYQLYPSNESKIDTLKTAVNSFIDSVSEKSPESQIAIVKFSGDKSERIGNDTYRDRGFTYNYSQIVKNLTPASSNVALKDAINALSPAGATAADYGMQHAQTIIADAANDGRKKVVIMFTDGEPNHQSGFDPNVANTAISASQAIKAAGATVYTIGVFAGADGTPVDVNNLSDRTNKYMHLVSSNYKEATSMDDTGAATYPTGGKSYFLSAGSSVDLNDIFHQISQEIGGSTIKLDSNSYLLDTVTPQFTMPENASEVKFYTMNCNGKDSFDESSKTPATGVTYTIDGNTLKVTGFDFSENWCGSHNGTYSGKKLIVEFTVKERAGFLGGNEVITNVGTDDGIYDKDNKNYGTFPPPTVDVPIQDVNVTAENKNVYLKGTADQLKKGATVTVGGIPLDLLTKENYGLEPWQTAYVNITVTVKDKDGNAVTDRLADLTGDTAYTIEVTVAPKDTGTVKEKSGSGSADIHVFKPELTFQDSTAYYGEEVPAEYAGNLVSTVWKNGGKTSTDAGVTMLDTKPELTLAYTPDPGKIADSRYTKQDVPVTVTVRIGGDDVTRYTTFVHNTCTEADCNWTTPTANGDPAFQVHIRTCTLTITKEGGAADEPYVFDLYKDDKKYSEVTIVGNRSATIVELPVGNYTIKENTAWSWRYPAPTYTDPVQLKRGEDSGGITCTNKKTLDFWLNGFSVVIRNIFGKKD